MQKPVNRAVLLKVLKDELENCEHYLKEKAHTRSPEFKKVVEYRQDQLPLLVNEGGLVEELAKARMRGEKIDTPLWHIKALYDVIFDFEDYKALGDNDGELRVLGIVFRELGEKKLSDRASDAMYTNNY